MKYAHRVLTIYVTQNPRSRLRVSLSPGERHNTVQREHNHRLALRQRALFYVIMASHVVIGFRKLGTGQLDLVISYDVGDDCRQLQIRK